jgi:hypothetical protein
LPAASARIWVLHALVERPRDRCLQEQKGVIRGQPHDRELRQAVEHAVLEEPAHGEHQADPLREQPARHERQCLRRHPVEPVRVVDDAQQRPLLGGVRQQAQNRQPDQEAIRRRARGEPEGRAQRLALRTRQMPETIDQGRAQRVQARERELHLGLHARRPGDPALVGGRREVPEQRGLADSRLATKDEHTALTRAHAGDQSLQRVALADPVEQSRR